jgi:hypothetical protein
MLRELSVYIMSREQSARQYHNIKTGNKSFKNVAKFKYFNTTLKNKNCFHEKN